MRQYLQVRNSMHLATDHKSPLACSIDEFDVRLVRGPNTTHGADPVLSYAGSVTQRRFPNVL